MRAFTDKETVEQVGKLHMTAMLAAPGIVIVESQGARTWRATQLGNKPGYIEITAIEGDRSARVYVQLLDEWRVTDLGEMALAHARRHGCPLEMMEAFAKSAVSMLGPTVIVRGTVLTILAPGPGDLERAACKMLELAWMTAHG